MKIRVSITIGAILMACGLVILGYWVYSGYKIEQMYATNAEDTTITQDEFTKRLIASREEAFEDTTEDTVNEFVALETLDADQEIEEVSIYNNVLDIKQLGILAYIGNDVEKETLKKGVGWHTNTAKPGQLGNCVIPGHSSVTYNCIFNNLDKIQLLDTFIIWDELGLKHVYYVTNKYITSPYDTSLFEKKVDGISQTILYTCAEHGTKRLVVIGKEFDDYDLERFKQDLDKEIGLQFASIVAGNTVTGLDKFINTWGKELPVRHVAMPIVEVNNIQSTNNYIVADSQRSLFEKKEHIFNTDSYVLNYYYNLWRLK